MPDTSSAHTNLARGYPIALAAAAILSTTAIFIRYLTQTYQIPPLVLAFWREVFVAVALLPILALARAGRSRPLLLRVRREHLVYLLGYGLMLACFNALWTLSVALNGAAVATVLVYCSAGFTALLGWWLLKERLDWAMLLAVFATFFGCVLVADALSAEAAISAGAALSAGAAPAWQANLIGLTGIITGVLSGLWYAIYSLMGRSAARRGLNPWTTLLYTFAFASVFLLLANLLPLGLPGAAEQPGELFWLGSAWAGWGVLLLLAVGPTLAGFGLYNVSLSYLPSSLVQLIVTLEPVFTAAIAYFLLGERLNAAQVAGSLVIMGSVLFLRVYEGRRSKREALNANFAD